MELQGKTCVVTGGTKGIGQATAILLGRAGANVAVVGRHSDEEARKTLAAIRACGSRAELIVADMAKSEEAYRCVQETQQRLGAPCALVHSAGGLVRGGLLEVTPEAWYEAFEVHVHAVFHLCRAAVPAMREAGEGAVVLISSVAGLRGLKMNLPYQVVKGALPQFARALAYELAQDNIRVNAVAPGIIRTRFHAAMTEEQKRYNLEHRIPLQREGTAEDVAKLIYQLITNDYITGETVVIDGGLTMRIA